MDEIIVKKINEIIVKISGNLDNYFKKEFPDNFEQIMEYLEMVDVELTFTTNRTDLKNVKDEIKEIIKEKYGLTENESEFEFIINMRKVVK